LSSGSYAIATSGARLLARSNDLQFLNGLWSVRGHVREVAGVPRRRTVALSDSHGSGSVTIVRAIERDVPRGPRARRPLS
jgi:hypothetical protein